MPFARRSSAHHPTTGRFSPAVVLAVAAGGAIGWPLRYVISEHLATDAGTFPRATFLVNVSGSFVLGFAIVVIMERAGPTRYVRPFMATGLLGAYTTFATFALETVRLADERRRHDAVKNTLLNLGARTIAAAAGLVAASAL